MRRAISAVVILALAGLGWPVAGLAQEQPQSGSIAGTAQAADQAPLVGYTARLRNVDTGEIVAEDDTDQTGGYLFGGLVAASYVVEIVSSTGAIVAVSATIPLVAGAVISGVAITATAAGVAAAAAAAGGVGAFFASTGGLVVLAGVGAGITAGAVAARGPASPAQ